MSEDFYRSFWRSSRWGQPDINRDERARLSAILDLLQACRVKTPARVLDLGCGRGWLTNALSVFGDVLGTDVSDAAVDRARELFPARRFERTDVPGLLDRHGPAAFDLIVSSEVIEHVERDAQPAFLRGARELLARGGCAIFTTPRGELWSAWRAAHAWEQPVEAWLTEAELDRLAAGAGFRVERRTRAHVYGITPASRVLASRPFRTLSTCLPPIDRVTYPFRIYQVALLRKA